jgi:hypothetical protein
VSTKHGVRVSDIPLVVRFVLCKERQRRREINWQWLYFLHLVRFLSGSLYTPKKIGRMFDLTRCFVIVHALFELKNSSLLWESLKKGGVSEEKTVKNRLFQL